MPPEEEPKPEPKSPGVPGRAIAWGVVLSVAIGVLLFVVGGWVLALITIPVTLVIAGVLLWWYDPTTRDLNEIGRSLMVSGLLAIVVGSVQYAINERQKDRDADSAAREKQRDLELSLSFQNDLIGAHLPGKYLGKVRLEGKSLQNANLQGAHLRRARLGGVHLEGAKLDGADLTGAHLERAHLDNASLVGAHLHRADLKHASLPNANLGGTDLTQATLDLTSLAGACLVGAHLRGAHFSSSNLASANLTRADVRHTDFEFDLRPSNLAFSGFYKAITDGRTRWPDGFPGRAAVAGSRTRAAAVRRRPPNAIKATVQDWGDGDTVRFRGRGLPRDGRARLVGINAPDLGTRAGVVASRAIQRLLRGRTVRVQMAPHQIDPGKRSLVYVWLSRTRTVNEQLLLDGAARVQAGPNTFLADRFRTAEFLARERGTGMWAKCPPAVGQ